jgi:hypothetical protein
VWRTTPGPRTRTSSAWATPASALASARPLQSTLTPARSHTYGYAPSNGAYAESYNCDQPGTTWHRDWGTEQIRGENPCEHTPGRADPAFCLDVTDGRFQPENIVQIWGCHDSCHRDFRNQQWVIRW